MDMIHSITVFFKPDYTLYEGVSRFRIYLLRIVFALTFVFVGMDSWTALVSHKGAWEPVRAVAFCVWAAYSTLSIIGLFNTLKMLPLVLFQIFYKTIWLVTVAYPLWSSGQLAGSPAEGMTQAFLWVILPIVAMPWKYLMKNYFQFKKHLMGSRASTL
jgi:hypothetical protein